MSGNATNADATWQLGETGRWIITVVFGSIILVGCMGNLLVIGLILTVKKLHSTVNLCLACLATADLAVLVFLPIIPWNILYDIDDSSLGLNFCIFIQCMDTGAVVCSCLIFLLVGVERYTVLCHPLKSLGWWTWKKVCVLLVIILFITVGISIPYGFATVYEQVILNDNTTLAYCYLSSDIPWLDHYHSIVNGVFFFLIIPVLFFLYGKMVIALKAKVPQSENQGTGMKGTSKARSQVVIMLVIVISVFTICLLPFTVYIFVLAYAEEALNSMDDESFFTLIWSARIVLYINHASNPIVYFLMSDNFREAFKAVFCKRPNRRHPSQSFQTISSSL